MYRKRRASGRAAFAVLLFALTAAAAITGVTYSGHTQEVRIDESCAHVTWPMIPAYCLDGVTTGAVRMVSLDTADKAEFAARFAVAFD
jgi:hypothetical protein